MEKENINLLYIDSIENMKSVLKGKQKQYLTKAVKDDFKLCKALNNLNKKNLDLILYNPDILSQEKLNNVIENILSNTDALLYVVINGQNAERLAKILSQWNMDESYKIIFQEELDSYGMDEFIKPLFLQKIVFIVADKNIEIKSGEIKYYPTKDSRLRKSRTRFLNSACGLLRELVSENRLSESLRSLKFYFDQNKSFDSRDHVIMLNASLSRLRKESALNLISLEQREKFINKITYSILELIKEKI